MVLNRKNPRVEAEESSRKKSKEIYRETVPAYGLSRKALQRYLEVEFSDELESAVVDQASLSGSLFHWTCWGIANQEQTVGYDRYILYVSHELTGVSFWQLSTGLL